MVLPGMSSEMLPIRASLRTFTAKKKRTPNLERRPSIMHYPTGAASHVDSSLPVPMTGGMPALLSRRTVNCQCGSVNGFV